MDATPYVELNEVLDELVLSVHRVLTDKVVGIYLQGSLAVGDFDEDSDVDFIVVLNANLNDEEVAALNEMHHILYAMPYEWAKHLEGSYFTLDELHGEPGKPVWYLDHGHVFLEKSNHCNTLVVRWILEHFGIELGNERRAQDPPAPPRGWGSNSGRLPHVDPQDLRKEIRKTLLTWGKDILADPEVYNNRFYQGFIVLNYCRMLHDIETGTVGSKKGGAQWAKKSLPEKYHDLIDRAWQTRPNPSISSRTQADPTDLQTTLELVQFAMNQIEET